MLPASPFLSPKSLRCHFFETGVCWLKSFTYFGSNWSQLHRRDVTFLSYMNSFLSAALNLKRHLILKLSQFGGNESMRCLKFSRSAIQPIILNLELPALISEAIVRRAEERSLLEKPFLSVGCSPDSDNSHKEAIHLMALRGLDRSQLALAPLADEGVVVCIGLAGEAGGSDIWIGMGISYWRPFHSA